MHRIPPQRTSFFVKLSSSYALTIASAFTVNLDISPTFLLAYASKTSCSYYKHIFVDSNRIEILGFNAVYLVLTA